MTDPGDYSRRVIGEYARHLADYAEMLRIAIDKRDDDGAELMRKRVVEAANRINGHFKVLASERANEASDAAASFFDKLAVEAACA